MNEAEYLEQQGEEAKAAMQATLKSMAHDAYEIADPARLTREHPWRMVAAAAAAGFVASKLLAHEEEQQTPEASKARKRRRLLRISRILAVTREIMKVTRPILDTIWAAALNAMDGHRANGDHLSQTPTADQRSDPRQS
jgi:hypothetical protein